MINFMGLSSPTGCSWSFRLRKNRLFLGDAVQNRSRDGKAEAKAEVEGYGVILWGFQEILWDFNVL
jgi:hypothetical protein